MNVRRITKQLIKAVFSALHLPKRPGFAGRGNPILPRNMIPSVYADLKTRIAYRAQHSRSPQANIRSRQQGAVEQRAQSVVFEHRGARNLLQKALAKDPLDRPAGVVGPEAEQEGGAGIVPAQDAEQARHALAGAAPGIDVDLEGEQFN